ncbi:MAG: type 1 glutamine amidotransferase [Mariprofundaceae bacterium]|nr:type 1 glutamine amidotransferase [Mariprofundaceae bacterium]
MNFLLLQHLRIEPAAIIGEMIEEAGHRIEVVRMDRDEPVPQSLAGFDGMLVMGGPMSANDSHLSYIRDEILLLKQAIAADFPVLGLCLGAQLLAKAAGAEIVASPVRELGWYPVQRTRAAADDPIFRALDADGLTVFQWHGETFTLPGSATLVATHPDVPHQAFRVGSSQYGLQFHIEVDQPVIELWIEAGESERQALGEAGVAEIRAQSPDYLPAAHAFCRQMVRAWLGLCDTASEHPATGASCPRP